MKKGIQKERDLVNYLEYHNYKAVRVAGSGAGTKKARPDIIAGNKRNIYAIELKSSSRNSIYIKKEQIKELLEFSKLFGAVPVVAVKFNYLPYCFMSVNDLTVTRAGNYTINRDKAAKFKNKFVIT